MSKIVPIQPANNDQPRGERPMSREERRIITEQMLETYWLNETVGYKEDWSDHKVSDKMGVPRVWIAQVRDETFGPHDTNERCYKTIGEARELLSELATVKQAIEPLLAKLQQLMSQAEDVRLELINRVRKQG